MEGRAGYDASRLKRVYPRIKEISLKNTAIIAAFFIVFQNRAPGRDPVSCACEPIA